jgi:nucleotide-binding universal stress UspA family protein
VATRPGDEAWSVTMTEFQGQHGGRIVVGVDGSESSKAALAWAIRQAALTGAEVDAVHAWREPVPYTYGYGYTVALPVPDIEKFERQVLDEAIAGAADLAPQVEIRPVLVQDNPAQALLDAAKGADLLVVGSRGHGGFAEALLGSVGQHCVHHADCPVVVIRGARHAA